MANKYHSFAEVPAADIPRSSFERNFTHKTTFDADYLVPIFLDEVLPGDTFNLKTYSMVRMTTPIFPLMDNIFLDVFYFFVPMRLLWDNWQKFCGEQIKPNDSIDFTVPVINTGLNSSHEGQLADYFGLPVRQLTAAKDINLLPFRAYHLIWDEWFRDQNLQNSANIFTDDSQNVISDVTEGEWYQLKKRNKKHDYFTSCLPWPQKGTAVDLPLGTQAPVVGLGTGSIFTTGTPISNIKETGGTLNTYNEYVRVDNTTQNIFIEGDGSGYPAIYADLTNATAATINQLREAFQIQKLLERDARGGTRYVEIIRSHFGVVSPDARIQRPEYLGGGSTQVNITPVAQTTSTDATSPQGNLAGFGTAHIDGIGFTKSFTEHGYIIGLINARADITYQQGLNRLWSRSTRYDFYWPALSQIGEQAVLSKEIYTDGSGNDDLVFGYQERYGEYRYKPSMITGKFRSNATGSLDAWHLSEEFGSRPSLNSAFIKQNTPMDRVLAVPTEPDFIGDFYFKMKCARPMPLYGTPGLIDHF
jgi:hypothetical protein